MQKLIFESAWDKTIAPRDRETIEQLFQTTKTNDIHAVEAITISQAFNHKEDLLVIVLIHNFRDEIFSFDEIEATYIENEIEIATQHFSFPKLELEPKTSMPWTFIFSKQNQLQQATLENGHLKLNV